MGGWGAYRILKKLEKGINKVTFSKELRVFQFPGKYLFLGVIFQNVFSPKAAGPAAPSFWGKSDDQCGGPRTHLEAHNVGNHVN